MNLDFDDDQIALHDALARLLAGEYGFEQRRRYQLEPAGYSQTFWRQLADQGFLGLPFSAEQGGLGYGAIERMIVMEAFGRALLLEPYGASVIAAGAVLRQLPDSAMAQALIAELIAGQSCPVLALRESQSRYELANIVSRAVQDGSGYRLSGYKIAVLHADAADQLLIVARSFGDSRDPAGLSLFRVASNADGLHRTSYRTQDGRRAADLRFENLMLPVDALLGTEGAALPLLEQAEDEAIAALAAEAVGAMQSALDLTVDYLKQRKQFGGPIGRFQALQHRAAEMLVELEQVRSMALLAALALEMPHLDERRRQLSAVKVQIGKSGRFVTEQAIQLHGGVGVSEEYAVGHYYRRLVMMEAEWGDSDHHLRRIARLGGLYQT